MAMKSAALKMLMHLGFRGFEGSSIIITTPKAILHAGDVGTGTESKNFDRKNWTGTDRNTSCVERF